MLLLQGQELGACLGDKAVVAKAGQEVICPPSDLVEDLLIHPSPTPRPAGDAPSHLEGCSSYWECELQIVCKAMTESHYIPSIFTADQLIHPNPAPRPAGDAPSHLEKRSRCGRIQLQIVCKAMTESHYIPSILAADQLIHPTPLPACWCCPRSQLLWGM